MYILSPDGLFYAFCGCPGALQTLLQGMGGLVLAQRRAAWCAIRQRTLRQVLEYLPQSTIRHSVCRPPCLRGCLVLSVHHLGGSVGSEVAVAGKPFRDAKGRSVWCGGVGFLERDKKKAPQAWFACGTFIIIRMCDGAYSLQSILVMRT